MNAADFHYLQNRRRFLRGSSGVVGVAALASLLESKGFGAPAGGPVKVSGVLGETHHAPKVKNVIYLFMAGGTSSSRGCSTKP